jgi:hypothetical protein
VGAQYLRDGDVVALEFTGVAGVVPFTVGGDRGGMRLRPRKRLRGSRIRRAPGAARDAWPLEDRALTADGIVRTANARPSVIAGTTRRFPP